MSLAETESDIRAAFVFHREQRQGLPVFGLEHGLTAERSLDLKNALGHLVRIQGAESIFKTFPLSVVACSSEIGYEYRGTGTDFWPKFEREIAASIGEAGRQAHTGAFLYAHKTLGLMAPPETPWTRNFRHIAWPITNAIASREIHRPLAIALRRTMTFAFTDVSLDELVARLTIEARSQQNTRLIEWLQQADVASALISRLLDLPIDDSTVEIVSLDRIVADLEADPIARQSVMSALERRKATKTKRASPLFRFRIVLEAGGAVSAALQVPNLDGPVLESLESELARCGGTVSLAEGGCELSFSRLAVGTELDLRMTSFHALLSGNTYFLHDAGASYGQLEQLRDLMPTVRDPMIFVEDAMPGHFGEWTSVRKIPKGRRVLFVTTKPIAEPEGLRCIANLEGVTILEIELPSIMGERHLSSAGAQIDFEPLFEIIGGIQIAEGILGPVFLRGMPVLVKREFGAPGEWTVRSSAAGPLRLGEKDVAALLDSAPDHQEIQVDSGKVAGKTEVSFYSVREAGRPLSIRLDPSSPSVEDIQRGQLRMQIDCPLELTDVGISITVDAGGTTLASASGAVTQIPATIGASSGIVRDLAQKLVLAAPDRTGHLFLEVSLHRIWKQRWRLDWDPVEVSWLNNDGAWLAVSDEQEFEVSLSEAATPLSRKAYDKKFGGPSTFRVLLPEANGTAVYLGAICDGPKKFSPGDIASKLPAKSARTLTGGQDTAGFEETVQGYLLWSVARPVHPIASAASRTVARRIEQVITEQLCGRTWLHEENRSQISAGSLFDVLALQAAESELAAGGELPPVPARLQSSFDRCLSEKMRLAWPQLSADKLNIDFENFAAKMDGAVASTFEEIASYLEGENAEAFGDVDPYSEPSDWQSALIAAVERMDGTQLSRMILPTERGEQLQNWDYSLPEADLVSFLAEIHTDLAPPGRGQWIAPSNIQDCLHLWIEPVNLLRQEDWLASLARFLQDRQTARALRYAALRFRAARTAAFRHG